MIILIAYVTTRNFPKTLRKVLLCSLARLISSSASPSLIVRILDRVTKDLTFQSLYHRHFASVKTFCQFQKHRKLFPQLYISRQKNFFIARLPVLLEILIGMGCSYGGCQQSFPVGKSGKSGV